LANALPKHNTSEARRKIPTHGEMLLAAVAYRLFLVLLSVAPPVYLTTHILLHALRAAVISLLHTSNNKSSKHLSKALS
jgi:hypothetical protein